MKLRVDALAVQADGRVENGGSFFLHVTFRLPRCVSMFMFNQNWRIKLSELSPSIIAGVLNILEMLGVFLLLGIFLRFFFRTRTVFFIKDRFWKLLGGKPMFHNVRAQLLFQELREIEHFRAEYGFLVNDLADIDKYLAWQGENNVPAGMFKAAANKIKKNANDKIYLDSDGYRIRLVVGRSAVVLGGFLAVLAIFVAFTPYVMASFKLSGERFYYGEGSFKLSVWGEPIVLEECKYNSLEYMSAANSQRFTEEQLDMLCEGLKDQGWVKEYFDRQRGVQRSVAVRG